MITGEIAILFASAAGIGAAAATWVYDRRLAKRLTDLRRDTENLKDQIRGHADMLVKTETAIVNLKRIESRLPVNEAYERFVGRLSRGEFPRGDNPVGKSPDLAAPFSAVSYRDLVNPVPDAKHPLYAKTGLPNQPVASLRPEAPSRRCLVCGFADRGPDGKPCPNCGD